MATSLTDFGPAITLTLARKTGRKYTLTTFEPDGVTPQDMSTATLIFEVSAATDSGGVLLQKGIGTGITYASPSSGVGVLTISQDDISSTLTFKSGVAYPFSLILTLSGGLPSLQLNGTFQVNGIA